MIGLLPIKFQILPFSSYHVGVPVQPATLKVITVPAQIVVSFPAFIFGVDSLIHMLSNPTVSPTAVL